MENNRPWSKALRFIFRGISSSNENEKSVNISRLRIFIAEQTQKLKGEYFIPFMNDVNSSIRDLMFSSNIEKVKAGVLALNAVVELEYDCSDYDFVIQWMNSLFKILHESKDISVSERASKCLGNLVRIYQEVLPHDYLDLEIHECLICLSKNVKYSEIKLITAVSIMENLLISVPNLVSLIYLENFLSLVELNLGSSNFQMRAKVVNVIRRSLELIKYQVPEQKNVSYERVYKVIEKYLNSKNPTTDKLDGALMALGVLLVQSGSFLDEKTLVLFKKILQIKENTSPLVKKSVMRLIPVLAKYHQNLFSDENLNILVRWLVSITMQPGDQRDLAYEVLAKLTLLLKKSMSSQLGNILNSINFSFFLHSKFINSHANQAIPANPTNFGNMANNLKYFLTDVPTGMGMGSIATVGNMSGIGSGGSANATNPTFKDQHIQSVGNIDYEGLAGKGGESIMSAMSCLSALVEVFGDALNENIKTLLPLIFETKISPIMINLLSIISKKIPYYRKIIQNNLFDIVSKILIAHQPEHMSELRSNMGNLKNISALNKMNSILLLGHTVPCNVTISKSVGKQFYSRSKIIGKTLKNLFSANKSAISSKNPIKEASLKVVNSGSGSGTTKAMGGANYQGSGVSGSVFSTANKNASTQFISNIMVIITAIDTISEFPFDSKFYPLNHLCDLVLPYINHGEQQVKKRAVISCKNILVKYVKTFFLLESNDYSSRLKKNNTFGFDAASSNSLAELKKIFGLSGERHAFFGHAIFGENHFASSYGCHFVNHFLESLFQFALGNPDQEMRYNSLACLDECFDPFLCQNRFLSYLFLFVNDYALEICKICLVILGRLSLLNPGKVLPFARSVLLDLIKRLTSAQLQYQNAQENACRLLSVLIREFPSLANLFIDSIIKILLKLIKDSQSPKFVSYSLCAIGDIAKSCGREVCPYLDEILPLLIETFQDRFSSSKRKNALQTLIDVLEYSGCVVDPYFKYPELIVLVLDKIVKETQFKSLFGKLLGILGALDPYLYKLICEKGKSISESYKFLLVKDRDNNVFYKKIDLNIKKINGPSSNPPLYHLSGTRRFYPFSENKMVSLNASIFPVDIANEGKSIPIFKVNNIGTKLSYLVDPMFSADVEYNNVSEVRGFSSELFYAAFILNSMLQFLNNPYDKQANLIQSAVQCSMDILIHLKSKAASFLYHFIPVWKNLMSLYGDFQLGIREIIFKNLMIITGNIKHLAKDHFSSILEMSIAYIDNPQLTLFIVALFEKLSLTIGDQFKTCLNLVLPKMVRSIQTDQSENYQITQRILLSWQVYGHLDQFTYIIIPTLASLLNEVVLLKNYPSSIFVPVDRHRTGAVDDDGAVVRSFDPDISDSHPKSRLPSSLDPSDTTFSKKSSLSPQKNHYPSFSNINSGSNTLDRHEVKKLHGTEKHPPRSQNKHSHNRFNSASSIGEILNNDDPFIVQKHSEFYRDSNPSASTNDVHTTTSHQQHDSNSTTNKKNSTESPNNITHHHRANINAVDNNSGPLMTGNGDIYLDSNTKNSEIYKKKSSNYTKMSEYEETKVTAAATWSQKLLSGFASFPDTNGYDSSCGGIVPLRSGNVGLGISIDDGVITGMMGGIGGTVTSDSMTMTDNGIYGMTMATMIDSNGIYGSGSCDSFIGCGSNSMVDGSSNEKTRKMMNIFLCDSSKNIDANAFARTTSCFLREYPLSVQKTILVTLSSIIRNNKNVSQYCLLILHPIMKLFEGIEAELVNPVLETLVQFSIELDNTFLVFAPSVRSCLKKARINPDIIELVFNCIKNKNPQPLLEKIQNSGNSTIIGSGNMASFGNSAGSMTTSANVSLFGGAGGSGNDVQDDIRINSIAFNGDPKDDGIAASNTEFPFENIISCISNAFSCFSVSDWMEWLKILCVNLLKESNVPPLVYSISFVQLYQPFVYKLFKLAFFACWNIFSSEQKLSITKTLSDVLSLDRIPIQVLQLQLDMIEYMEHQECDFNIDARLLSELATKCRAHARALYYKEREYRTYTKKMKDQKKSTFKGNFNRNEDGKSSSNSKKTISNHDGIFNRGEEGMSMMDVRQEDDGVDVMRGGGDDKFLSSLAIIEDLISIYHQLEYYDSAQGMLHFVQNTPYMQGLDIGLDEENIMYTSSRDLDLPLCRMRCYHGLGKWDILLSLCEEQWKKRDKMDHNKCMQVASLALSAALNLSKWNGMERYVSALPEETSDGSFYRAILSICNGNEDEFSKYFSIACDLTTNDLKTLLRESYSRAYPMIIRMQQLVELEEVFEYKKVSNTKGKKSHYHQNFLNDRKETILSNMTLRLSGIRPKVDNWQRFLNIRSMVEEPQSNMPLWTKFGNLAMKKNRPKKANQIFCLLLCRSSLLSEEYVIPDDYSILKYSVLNSMYSLDDTRDLAIRKMEEWTAAFSEGTNINAVGRAKCYLKLVRWKSERIKTGGYNQKEVEYLLELTRKAIKCDSRNYKAWKMFAALNNKILLQIEKNLIANNNSQLGPIFDEVYAGAGGNEGGEMAMMLSEHVKFFAYALIESVQFSPKENLEDLLQLMFLWFKYGSNHYFESIVGDSIDRIPIVKWLVVIPQLFSHVNIPMKSVRMGLEGILTLVGKYHPQAIAFAINFDKNSFSVTRVRASQKLELLLRKHCSLIMDESHLVSVELNRVAFLLKEKFHEGIQDAYRYYYYEKNIEEMVNILDQLNCELQKNPETHYELMFHQVFKKDLDEAWKSMSEYVKSRSDGTVDPDLLARSWDKYVQVFREIRKSLERESERSNLKNLSPRLFKLKNLGLCVPGTYKYNLMENDDDEKRNYKRNVLNGYGNGGMDRIFKDTMIDDESDGSLNRQKHENDVSSMTNNGILNTKEYHEFNLRDYFCDANNNVTKFFTINHSLSKLFFDHFSIFSNCSNFYNYNVYIRRFSSTVKLIKSKQNPKKITIYGNDGCEYGFLLKAREDLRQDERVMQLFNLVNLLLNRAKKYNMDLLYVRTFSIIPISPSVGLIEWVPHCDTIYSIIKDYRLTHNIALNAERNAMSKCLPSGLIDNYYRLTMMQKLELFEIGLASTNEFDFERAMYFSSKNSEDWLEKRLNYTQSLALMSIVGYVLGLGDRHPNNFLLCRKTGILIHIDFGDCFEVTMDRENFPEKVPFRLTRMFIAAMDVAGVNGIFKCTCERVMKILRQNSDSIISVLKSFVNDPSLNWRLMPSYLKYKTATNLTSSNNITPASSPLSPDDLHPYDDIFVSPNQDSLYDLYRPQRILPNSIDSHLEISLSEKTKKVLKRVSSKLNGNEFEYKEHLDVASQVSLLIQQATNNENLSCSYLGFCPFW